MRKFLAFYRTHLSDAFAYRLEGFIWFLIDITSPLIMILFWKAAFISSDQIAGFSLNQIIIYYFGVMIVDTLIHVHPEFYLAEEIRLGSFSNYLIRPLNFFTFKISGELAWKTMRCIYLGFFTFIIVKLFFPSSQMFIQWPYLGLFLISLLLAFLMLSLVKLSMGLSTVWFGESSWLFFSFGIIHSLLSGKLIPLDLFPSFLNSLNNYLPFKYFLYFPLSILLNKINSWKEIILGLTIQMGWLLCFLIFYRLILKSSSRKYSAYGG